ncbi:MAG TPA: hypothetical protein EYQ86_03485 [Bacteroidetes bacterium]|nr:hypothetical protein [Bacteroidota bacterium]
MKKAIAVLYLTTIFSFLSFAQNRTVVINMNNDVLHCPHLGVKFKTIFSSKDYVKNIDVNTVTSVAKFDISKPEIGEIDLRTVIVDEIGYPEAEIGSILFKTNQE